MLIQPNDELDKITGKAFEQLGLSLSQPDHPFRFAILSTVQGDQPQSRYVVLRDFQDGGEMCVFTDYRSDKVDHLRQNPNASLLFYHGELRVQLRFSGKIQIHHGDRVSHKYWKSVTEQNSKAYRSLHPPGTPLDSIQEAYEWTEETNFAVLCFTPETLDILQLNGAEHIRAGFTRSDSDWQGTWITP